MSLPSAQKKELISQASIIILIWRVVEQMRKRGDGLSLDCILNEEKLLHLALMALEKKTLKAPPFDLTEQVARFIQKINKLTMESFNRQNEQINTNIFIKAIDLLMVKSLGKYVTPLKVLGQLKVLTFNNLACIYKRKKKFTLALRAVSFALEIEEVLVKQQRDQAAADKHNIITTYLNKAAILSQMKKHDKAIEQINKGIKVIKIIEEEIQDKLLVAQNDQERKKIQEKRCYSMYMKMIVYYNLGAQKEHLNLTDSAIVYYKKGKAIAQMIANDFMVKKFDMILNKLNQTKIDRPKVTAPPKQRIL